MKQPVIAIIANGEPFTARFFRANSTDVDIIIAADGGSSLCRQHNIIPDYIIGDLDSITADTRDYFKDVQTIHLSDQYSTDMEKALGFADSLNPAVIKIFSALGLRSDHSMANLLFFSEFNKKTELKIYDNNGCLQILEAGRHLIQNKTGRTLSLFSLQAIQKLTLSGFRYELHDQDYQPFFVGISNVVESPGCSIEFASGILYMYELFKND